MKQITLSAPTLQDAMIKVKDQLGAGATILSWRNLDGAIEVTAALNNDKSGATGIMDKRSLTSDDPFERQGTAPRYDVFAADEEFKRKETEKARQVINENYADPKGLNALIQKGVIKETGIPVKKIKPAPIEKSNASENSKQASIPIEAKSLKTSKPKAKEAVKEIIKPTKKTSIHPLISKLANSGMTLSEIKPFAEYFKDENLERTFFNILETEFIFDPIEAVPEHAIMLIGPAGSGKTVTIAKLAARVMANNGRVLAISTDTERQGGAAQLQLLCDKLGADFIFCDSIKDAYKAATQALENGKVVFIDTPAATPLDPSSMRLISRLIEETNAEPILCSPCDYRSDDLTDLMLGFMDIGVNRTIITRMDLTQRRAGILTSLLHTRLKIAQLAPSPFISGIVPATPKRLMSLIMDGWD